MGSRMQAERRCGSRIRGVALALATLVGAVPLALAPAPASGAAQIGEAFTPAGVVCSPNTTRLQSGSPGGQYAAPFAGVITSWSFAASATDVPRVKLKVARFVGGSSFTIVGESDIETPTPATLNTYPLHIPVQAGDVIGLSTFTAANGPCGRTASGYLFHSRFGDPPVGSTLPYGGPFSGLQFDVAASLEEDCDSDGLGDETQDPELPPIPACDPTPPETTITGGPKNVVKTEKKRAKVTFTFASSEPGTFECSLDGAPFTACSSPSTHKVKAGRRKPKEHTFQVRAIDAAGNPDPAPAADDFKAKRKRKRKK
jgi:hypothetical protein